jgi:hypothetical protein
MLEASCSSLHHVPCVVKCFSTIQLPVDRNFQRRCQNVSLAFDGPGKGGHRSGPAANPVGRALGVQKSGVLSFILLHPPATTAPVASGILDDQQDAHPSGPFFVVPSGSPSGKWGGGCTCPLCPLRFQPVLPPDPCGTAAFPYHDRGEGGSCPHAVCLVDPRLLGICHRDLHEAPPGMEEVSP